MSRVKEIYGGGILAKAILLLTIFFIASNLYAGEIKLPPIKELKQANGLQLLVIEQKDLPIVALKMVILSGSANDPMGKGGIANFTGEMLRGGTKSKSSNQISESIDFTGGSLEVSTTRDATYITCQVLSKYFDIGLELMSDVLMNSTFPVEEIERIRKQILADITNNFDDPDHYAEEQFYRGLFGNHPYGHPLSGSVEEVAHFTADDVKGFYETHYRPNNAILAVVGDVEFKLVKDKVNMAFKGWQKKEVPPLEATIPQKPQGLTIYLFDKAEATQSSIRFGTIGAAFNNPDYFPMREMNLILGATSTSRMFEAIRNQRGLVYGIYSWFDNYKLPGAFTVATNTNNDSTAACIKAAIEEIGRMRNSDITAEELTLAQDFMKGYFAFRFETPEQIADQILNIKIYGFPSDYISTYRHNVESVTSAEIRTAAEKFLDSENMLFIVVGKADNIKAGLEKIGKVIVRPFGGE